MDPWNDAMQDHTSGKITFAGLLSACAQEYLQVGRGDLGINEFDSEGGEFDEDGFGFKEEKKAYDAVDAEFAEKKFLEIGSPAASLRLIKDLKNIKRTDPKVLGFTAEPCIDPEKKNRKFVSLDCEIEI